MNTEWRYPATFMDFLNTTFLFVVFTLFPNGRFVPRWIRWAALAWIIYNLIIYYVASFVTPLNWLPGTDFPVWLGFMGGVVVAQIYRYRSVPTPAERQQTKWIVFALATIILAQRLFGISVLVYASLFKSDSLYTVLAANIMIFVFFRHMTLLTSQLRAPGSTILMLLFAGAGLWRSNNRACSHLLWLDRRAPVSTANVYSL